MTTKKYSGNQPYLKELNIISCIRAIRSHGIISRVELADNLGLSRSTITAIINKLLEEKLVIEVGIGDSKGGRPRKLLQFNTEAAYIISIDWSPMHIKLFISDLKGKIFLSTLLPYDVNQNINKQIKKVISELKAELSRLPEKPHHLLGIGIGVPGIVDQDIVSSYDLDWDKVPLAIHFAEAFDCPVIIENIANTGLIAERYFGNAKGEENVCYLRLDKGIHASLLYKDQLYRGNEGFVGHIGHSVIDVHGKKCICGNRGCWQNYASESALIKYFLEISNMNEITMNAFIKLVKENNPAALKTIHKFSEYLAIGISNIINTLNPGLIVIDSSLNEISTTVYNPLIATINKIALPYPNRKTKIVFSSLGENAIIYGTTTLIFDKFFAPPRIR